MKKRVLFISQQFPYPLTDGGNIRTFKILEALAGRYEVCLVAGVCRGADPDQSLRSVQGLGIEAVCLPDVKSRAFSALFRVLLRGLLKRQPLTVAWNYNPHIRREVDRRLASGGWHTLHCNHLDTVQYVIGNAGIGGARILLDTHNILFQYRRKAASLEANPLRRAFSLLEAARLRAYELRAFRSAHRLLVCSAREARALADAGLPAVPAVVPNGVDCAYFHPPAAGYAGNPPAVVFTGAMGYRPNSDAAVRFIREVMPILRRELPGVRFLAVGKDPPPELLALARVNSDVTVTGKVPDVREYVWGSRVFAVPIRMGAGTRLKVLEAFAMGIPAVSTALGAEGIDHAHGENILIADDPGDMAAAILRLMRDAGLHRALSERALSLARERYDWESVGRGLLGGYED